MAKEEKDKKEANGLKTALWAGVWVLIMLAVFTFGEFLLAAIALPWGYLLLLVAIWKSYYIVKTYMHVGPLFGGDEEAH